MRKVIFAVIILLLIIGLGAWWARRTAQSIDMSVISAWSQKQAQQQQLEDIIAERQRINEIGEDQDPFGDDDKLTILFVGLDNRMGQTAGHCDAIQFIEIDRAQQAMQITAVPRGTFAPLPGSGYSTGDYYVSNACAIGGFDYGVKQIEKIASKHAEYIVVVGFSSAMGIFRQLDLPAVETMQWLRHRQGYAVGEPQRARNHSNFIKQMLIEHAGKLDSRFSLPAQYVIYRLLDSDLSFKQMQIVADEIAKLDFPANPDRIRLDMRPAHSVIDFKYEPDKISEQLSALLEPIKYNIPEGAYQGQTQEQYQKVLVENMEKNLDNREFITWAYENYLWLQIEDDNKREAMHFELMKRQLAAITDPDEREQFLADYIIEMQGMELGYWEDKARKLLEVEEFNRTAAALASNDLTKASADASNQ